MATEKSQQDLIHGIEGFDASKLKHAQTQEKNPLPDKDGKSNIYIIIKFIQFKHKLNPSNYIYFVCFFLSFRITPAIEQEKEKLNFINGIENFDSTKLKHTETMEKNPLPTKEIIEEEKQA